MKVGRVILVAPWIDVEEDDPNAFFKFIIDANIASRCESLTIFNSIDDVIEIQTSVTKLRKELDSIIYREFEGRGHFTHKYMPDDKFPELLEVLLK